MTLKSRNTIVLPQPKQTRTVSIQEALSRRRSVRDFTPSPMNMDEVAQLLWAAQGITHPEGFRTAPSAGALYPLEVYLIAGDVTGLAPGVYKYRPKGHGLTLVQTGDQRRELAKAALGQSWVAEAPAVLVIAAIYERTASKYGERAERYVPMEVGHAAQNVYLQATALGLGTTVVGAFRDAYVKSVVPLALDEQPLALMPLGRPETGRL